MSASQIIPIAQIPNKMPGKRKMAFRKVKEESQRKPAPYGKAEETNKAGREGSREREDEKCTI